MAQQINGNQLILITVQVGMKSGDLTGHSGKQHQRLLLKKLLDILKYRPKIALHMLRTAEPGQILRIADDNMAHPEIIIIDRAADITMLAENIIGGHCEKTARRTDFSDVIGSHDGIALRLLGILVKRMLRHALFKALSAVSALLQIHLRNEKALIVLRHGYGFFRAQHSAGAAAGAVRFPDYGHHGMAFNILNACGISRDKVFR